MSQEQTVNKSPQMWVVLKNDGSDNPLEVWVRRGDGHIHRIMYGPGIDQLRTFFNHAMNQIFGSPFSSSDLEHPNLVLGASIFNLLSHVEKNVSKPEQGGVGV